MFRKERIEDPIQEIIGRYWLHLYRYRGDFVRVCFLLVHDPIWQYQDYWQKKKKAPHYEVKDFCYHIITKCPFLSDFTEGFYRKYKEFEQYWHLVPLYGAILLSPEKDKVLIVRSFQSKNLGFPKGKINISETDQECALREVEEETGVDISGKINPKEYILLEYPQEKFQKYFIVQGVEDTEDFKPEMECEIFDIKFRHIKELLEQCRMKRQGAYKMQSKFKYVYPFIGLIIEWIRKKERNPEDDIKLEVTLSQEIDEYTAEDSEQFTRGLYSQFIKHQNFKAKRYYKSAILVGMMRFKAARSLLNMMILARQTKQRVLRTHKHYKALWIPEKYHFVKDSIHKIYDYQLAQAPYSNNQSNLVLIYEFFDRQKSWENDEMFARRLMNYDVSIIHVIKVYPDRVGSSKIVRRFVTKNYANTYFYYIVELLSSFDLCELKRIGRKKICNFEPLFSNQVYINSEEYYSFIEHNHKSTHKLKMEVSAKSKYIQNISREILAGIDFTTKPKLEPEPIESTLPSVLEDFHFTFSHLD